jgi:hypothetical protein
MLETFEYVNDIKLFINFIFGFLIKQIDLISSLLLPQASVLYAMAIE